MCTAADRHDLGHPALIDGKRKAHDVAIERLGAGQVAIVEEGDGQGGGLGSHAAFNLPCVK